MTRILLIDDDAQLVALLGEYLTRDGFAVHTAKDGAAGVAEALSGLSADSHVRAQAGGGPS